MQSERFVYQVRQLASEELMIRYGIDVPFEADSPVRKQLQILPKIAVWVAANEQKLQAGHYYFDGKLMV